MARNAIESEFRTSKMGAGGHFVKIKKIKMVRNAKQSYFWTSKMATGGHLKKNIYQKSYRHTDSYMLGTREYTLCSPFRANAHNASCK